MMKDSDFQSIYREHAYEVYRDAFEELRDPVQTRECVYQVFKRIRAEGLTDPVEIREKIPVYRADYVAQIKTAQLDVDQVWYRIRNDELTSKNEETNLPSFRERLREEAKRTREARKKQELLKAKREWQEAIKNVSAAKDEIPEDTATEEAEAEEIEAVISEAVQNEQPAEPEKACEIIDEASDVPEAEKASDALDSVQDAEENMSAAETIRAILSDIPLNKPQPEAEENTPEADISEEEGSEEADKNSYFPFPSLSVDTSEIDAAAEAIRAKMAAEVSADIGPEDEEKDFAAEEEELEYDEPADNEPVEYHDDDEEYIYDDESADEPVKRKSGKAYWIVFIVILLIFLWVVADILMYKGIVPGIDLGYSWFNSHLFTLFPYA